MPLKDCSMLIAVTLLFFHLVWEGKALPKSPDHENGAVVRREPSNSSFIKQQIIQGYDNNERPFSGAQPVVINVSAGIIAIGDINEATMGFGVDMFLRQRWLDPRLAYGVHDRMPSSVVFKRSELEKLWLPDTQFFSAEKEDKGRGNSVILTNIGVVVYLFRVHVTASQKMDFRNYPFDYQNMKFTLSSYVYDASKIQYNWESLELYDLHHTEFDVRNMNKAQRHELFYTGNHSMLDITFRVAREVEYFLLLVYFPSFVCTVISWLAFWLDPADISNRIALILTILLAAVLLLSQANQAMPTVGYLKKIDWFLIVSILFILSALLESLIVYNICRVGEDDEETAIDFYVNQQVEPNLAENKDNANTVAKPSISKRGFNISRCFSLKSRGKQYSHTINKLSKVVLPAAYIVYCAVSFRNIAYRADFE